MTDKTLAYPDVELLANDAGLLYERAGSATYAAYGRLEWHPDQRFEDARQAAAAAYWQAHQRQPLDTYCWTAARYGATNELRHNSIYTRSLDAPDQDDRDPWVDKFAATNDHSGALAVDIHQRHVTRTGVQDTGPRRISGHLDD